jgi:hypothetical protein
VNYRSAINVSSRVSICCCLDTSVDLWVMRRMAPVPHLPSGPAASRLGRADRPWRSTSSSLFDRCPQRAYYRFYYGRPRIVVDTKSCPPTAASSEDLQRGSEPVE